MAKKKAQKKGTKARKKKTRATTSAVLDAEPGGGVDVLFDLDPGTNAKLARCYLSGTSNDLANNMGKPHGVLKAQRPGSTLTVVVDVKDVPSTTKRGIFKVTHANRPSISATSEDGTVNYDLKVV